MTDTTDIKTLREKFETLSQIGDFYYFAKDLLDQLEAERQRADDAEKERGRIDRRNAELNSTLERWSVERAENANEIEELKGDQVPVEYQIYYHNHGTGCGEWCRIRTKERYEELQREHAGDNDFSFRTLFTAPQKPFVSRIDFESYYSGVMGTPMSVLKVLRNGDSYSETEGERLSLAWSSYQAAIESACGIVKDGE